MAWWDDAACRGQLDLFDVIDARPSQVGRLTHMTAIKRARLMCLGCPVAAECAADAARTEPKHRHRDAHVYLYSMRAGETTRERTARRRADVPWQPGHGFEPLTPGAVEELFRQAGIPRVARRVLTGCLENTTRRLAGEVGYPLGPRLMEADRDFVVWVIEKVAAHYDLDRKTKDTKKKKKEGAA